MNLFDGKEHLKKYNKLEEIIQDYYGVRLSFYQKRKDYLISEYERELLLLSNRARFIQETLDDKIDMRKKSKLQIQTILTEHKYAKIDGDEEYKYLVKMPMDSVTDENVKHLLSERDSKRAQHKQLTDTSIQALWTRDLDELEQEYKKWASAAEAAPTSGAGGGAAAKKKMVIKKA